MSEPKPIKQGVSVSPQNECRRQDLVRDVRSPLKKLGNALVTRHGFLVVGILTLLSLAALPAFWPLQIGSYLCLYYARRKVTGGAHLPMRIPDVYKGKDFGELPASGKFERAKGKFYIGNEYDGYPTPGQELWASPNDLLTHMLILGTTGAGKTETLVSLAYNYLALGSGFIYVDPKAAPKLAAQIYTMCRLLGRDDDFLVINFAADTWAQETLRTKGYQRTPKRETNTQNPFAVGTANQLCQLLFAMMPGGDGESGNAIFSSNAQNLISGLIFVLVEMRDKGIRTLSIETLRHYLMNYDALDELARSTEFSGKAMLAIQTGLIGLGWNKSKKQQSDSFEEQFQYARAYFGKILSFLADNYGRLYNVSHGELDPVDAILSRRIALILIPSMDKDPKELKSIGQLSLATVKNACAVGLGDVIQGSLKKVLGSLPTTSSIPYGITVDEFGAIAMEGFEIVLTQGRGLGIAAIIANQDWSGLQRASKEVAGQMLSNTKIKVVMTCVDPFETRELAEKLFGKAVIMQTSGYSVNKDQISGAYRDSLNTSIHEVNRVEFDDLQRQVEGEFYLSFKGKVIRGKMFYAAPPLHDNQQVRLAYQLKMLPPDVTLLRAKLGDISVLKKALTSLIEGGPQDVENAPGLFQRLKATFDKYRDDMTTPRSQIGIEALLNFSQGQTASDPVPLSESAPQEGVSEEPDLTDFDMMEQIRDSLDQGGTSPLLNIEGALKFDEDPVVDLKEDFIEIGLAAGLSADDAETTAVESENAINEALSVAYAPPLPDPGTDVEAELSALVESMEFLTPVSASDN